MLEETWPPRNDLGSNRRGDNDAPSGIDEPYSIAEERSVDRIEYGEFSKCLDGEQYHDPTDNKTDHLNKRVSLARKPLRWVLEAVW